MCCLRFLSDNAYYHFIGDALGVSKASICRINQSVVTAVNDQLFNDAVRWPENMETNMTKYYEMHRMPSVCSTIDSSLIKIKAPSNNEYQYVDRHGNHSINALFVAGADHEIYFCSKRWPGSVHDARVLRNSALFNIFENYKWRPFSVAVILGDSAFPCNDWILTPFLVPSNETEAEFNRSHKKLY